MSPTLRRVARSMLLLSTALVSMVLAVATVARPARETLFSRLTADRREHIEEEIRHAASRRFDQPNEAEQFYVNRRTGPILTRGPNATRGSRTLDPAAYLPALREMRAMPRFSTASNARLTSFDSDQRSAIGPVAALGMWTNVGPSNQGGRTRALLVDPTSPNVMYAGGVAGGVWKSTDAGGSWTSVAPLHMANVAVVTLAFDPLASSTLYAGTGELLAGDGRRGAGIFKSVDAGATWNQLTATNTANFSYTMHILVSPRNRSRLFAATATGVWRSVDGGATWVNLIANPAGGCTELAVQKGGASGYVFAACGTGAAPGAAIYRAVDADTSPFVPILSVVGQGRSSLAVAPSSENVVYVMSAQGANLGGYGADGLLGVFRSTASGDPGTFTVQVDGTVAATTESQLIAQVLLTNPGVALCSQTPQFANQGGYDNVLAVDPLDHNRIWAGGIDLFRSDDGGRTWGAAGYWWLAPGSHPLYHHADQHRVVFHPAYNGTTNRVMFAASDGGVDRIDDARAPVARTRAQLCNPPASGMAPWVDRNTGYVTTQFYGGATSPDGWRYLGGLQDNGTMVGTSAGSAWSMVLGGDGGHVALDTGGDGNDGNDVVLAENTKNSLQKSVDGGATFAPANVGIVSDPNYFLFITPFAMNEGITSHVWIGGADIWRSTDQAGSWTRATAAYGTCGHGSVSAIAAHPLDPNRVLVGMSDGCYHYHHAALSAPSSGMWPGGNLAPGSVVSAMAWDPTNVNVAYATISNFGVVNVFKSIDGGRTWSARSGSGPTAIPKIPALTVVVNPADAQQVFVGTDLGVFTSIDGGASWAVETTGFANTPVESLRISQQAPHHLFAFTHGRGAWRVPIGGATTPPPTTVGDSYSTPFGAPLTVSAPGVLANDQANGGSGLIAQLVSTTSHGALSLGADGSVTYTPGQGFSGPDGFTYRAVSGAGAGNVVAVTIAVAPPVGPQPPGTPAGFTASADASLLSLRWGVPTTGGAPTGYTLVARTAANGPVLATLPVGNVTSFSITAPDGVFVLSVFATNAVGASPESNPATVAIPGVPPPPGHPTGLKVSIAGSSAAFSWTRPATGGPVGAYVFIAGFTPGFANPAASFDLPPAQTSVTIHGIPPGTYYVRVYARNSAGNSQFSSNEVPVPIGGGGLTPPGAPTLHAPVVSGSSVALSWVPGGGGSPTSYVLAAALAPGGPPVGTVPLGGTSVTLTGVPPGTYYLRVAAVNAAGSGPYSNEVSAVIQVAGSTIPSNASYRATITGRVLASGGVVSTFVRDAMLEVRPPLDPQALGVSNGPNPRDIGIVTDASPFVGVAGALAFGTNTGFCVLSGCSIGNSVLDTSFVTIDQARGEVRARVDGNVWGLPLARLDTFNIFNALSGPLAHVYQVLTGDLVVAFGAGGQTVTGQMQLGGASGFSVASVSTIYDATFSGVRVR